MDNQEHMQKLMSLFNADKLLSKKDVEDVIAALVRVLASHKADYENKAGDMQAMVEATVQDVLAKYDTSLKELSKLADDNRRQTNQEVKARLDLALDRVNSLANEIATKRPKDGKDGKDGAPGKDGTSPDIEEIITEVLKRLSAAKSTSTTQSPTVVRGGGIRQQIHVYDLSDQCDGNTKTFKVPLNFGILGVYSTQAPIIYRPGIDYTTGHRTLTLTDQVGAPQTGQSLTVQFLK